MDKIIRRMEYGEGAKLHYLGGNSIDGKSLSTEDLFNKINELVDKVNELEKKLKEDYVTNIKG